MIKKTYAQKLQDPRWKAKRLEILERDLNTCKFCGEMGKMHVHHKFYINGLEPWEYDNNCLMTLCGDCHKLHHEREKANDKDYPALFYPPHKTEATVYYEDEVLDKDFYNLSTLKKRIPATIIQSLKSLNKAISENDRLGIYENYVFLDRKCTVINIILITKRWVFGEGDVTELKQEQYF